MNWIRENKFLSVFLGFVIAGAGALGFLLFQAMGNYAEVNDAYANQLAQLNTLQALAPYPNKENLDKYKEQKASLNAEITKLKDNLAKYEFPLEPATPEQFQDQLRTAVNSVTEKAKQMGPNVLPKTFALGFERYLTETPTKDAAAPLSRELKSIEFIVNELLDSKVDSFTHDVNRAPLPEETGQKPPPKALLFKHPFEITFVSEQGRFRKMLNDIVSSTKQFFIVRLIQVKNQVDKSPAKISAAPVATSGTSTRLTYLFGAEKLEITMKMEIVDFAPAPEK